MLRRYFSIVKPRRPRAISIVREAARAGAGLVAFPETYIPAFPAWAALWAPIDNHDLFVRMTEQSVSAHGKEIAALRREANALGITIAIKEIRFIEQAPDGTLMFGAGGGEGGSVP
jgi:predicted amidohydrolase